MKHHNQLRSGSLLTYVQMTLNIIVSVAYTPVSYTHLTLPTKA